MTIQQIMDRIEQLELWIFPVIFLTPPLLAWLLRFTLPRGRAAAGTWKYFFSFLVYAACLPGIFAFVLCAYSLFFLHANLLTLNIVIYYLPILTMILTLVLISKSVPWKLLPGVERLHALMVLIGISIMLALAVVKTRIWIFFGSTFATLFVLAILCFLVLKWGFHTLFRAKDEP